MIASQENKMIEFNFEDKNIRIEKDEQGKVWFVAKDVMSVLGIKSQAHALRKLKNTQRGWTNMNTLGGAQELATVSESGLYALAFQSRKASAQKFQDWVTEDVLPSIRKTGSYSLPKEIDPLDQLKMHVAIMEKQRQEIRQLNFNLEKVAVEAKQENDTLTADQITELDQAINKRFKELGVKDHRVIGYIRKAVKNQFFEISWSRTYKELARRDFKAALELVKSYNPPGFLQ